MFHRISTKLVLAVLAAVVLPFLGFAVFVDSQLGGRLTFGVVRPVLKSLAQEIAEAVDAEVLRRRQDIEFLARDSYAVWALDEYKRESELVKKLAPIGEQRAWGAKATALAARGMVTGAAFERRRLSENMNDFVDSTGRYQLLLLVEPSGELVAASGRSAAGEFLSLGLLTQLFERNYASEPWFAQALVGETVLVDHHSTPFGLVERAPAGSVKGPENYFLGFGAPVKQHLDPDQVSAGVLYGLVSWRTFQELTTPRAVKESFVGFVGSERASSAYAWIWASDADTILAHANPELYGKRISGPEINLPQLVEAARSTLWGEYPEYVFQGVRKNAAFKHCRSRDRGGFGWVVGVGIDNKDVLAPLGELRTLLFGGTAAVVLVIVVWMMIIARRTTEPIIELRKFTKRVAEGDLDARIDIRRRDEIGELAASFNAMTAELGEKTAQLVKAEKDAAWREMARQIAHDIKGPLTPIKLSLDLMRRARRDRAPNAAEIEERTLELIDRQVDNLREIATDFYEFTGGRAPRPEEFELGDLLDEVLQLHNAWAAKQHVRIRRLGPGGLVRLDRGKLRRALVNLVANGLQAMEDGGRLEAHVGPDSDARGTLLLEIRDTGVGLRDEDKPHLFEPNFTTRSEGTGLGLAIAWRVLEEMGGTIEVEGRAEGRGTVARVRLPHHAQQDDEQSADE